MAFSTSANNRFSTSRKRAGSPNGRLPHHLGRRLFFFFPSEYLREPDLAMPDSELAKNNHQRQVMQQTAAAEMDAIWRSIGAATYEGTADSNNLLKDTNGNAMPNNLLAWHPTIGLFSSWVRNQYGEQLDCRATLMSSYPADVRDKMRDKWHPLHTALYIWNKSQLANVLLSCLGDRTEMAHSVEGRTPFLDHHLAEYVNNFPPSVKLAYAPPQPEHDGKKAHSGKDPIWQEAGFPLRSLTSKWILREAARPYILDELYNRKKHPFLAPTKWPQQGPLHQMFKSIATRESVEKLGFVDPQVVEKAFSTAFGDKAEPRSFRILCEVSAWIMLADKFNILPAKP
ncbi:asparagine synthase [Trichoderma harzianum]|uniref:Asparagine synthase n=1 Tax=Trichoderma harzianum TaxID=5544 RepID=A0A0G0A6B8_TRIHA|nr:asparagine synthase [Trichoderma harzianum]